MLDPLVWSSYINQSMTFSCAMKSKTGVTDRWEKRFRERPARYFLKIGFWWCKKVVSLVETLLRTRVGWIRMNRNCNKITEVVKFLPLPSTAHVSVWMNFKHNVRPYLPWKYRDAINEEFFKKCFRLLGANTLKGNIQ